MDVSLFRRGVKVSRLKPRGGIQTVPIPKRVVVPLGATVGVPCKAQVDVGEKVRKGQILALPRTEEATTIHAPVSGEVVALERIIGLDGSEEPVITIETDGKNEWIEKEAAAEPLKLGHDALLSIITKSGIVAASKEPISLGHMLKEAISPKGYISATGEALKRAVTHLAIRFVDPDPFMTHLGALAAEVNKDTGDLELGVELLQQLTEAIDIHFVLSSDQSLGAIEKLANDRDWQITRVRANQYPDGGDVLVAGAVSKKETPVSFSRVHESGVLVIDIDNVLEVTRAVRDGEPVTDKVVSVAAPTGADVYRVPIGYSAQDLVNFTGFEGDWGKVTVGGGMLGMAHHTLDFPISHGLFGLALFEREKMDKSFNAPCMGCGLCVMACPMRLLPGMLSRYCEFESLDLAEQAHLFNCIECGCCGHVCPAGRSMVQFMVHGKTEILKKWRSGQ